MKVADSWRAKALKDSGIVRVWLPAKVEKPDVEA